MRHAAHEIRAKAVRAGLARNVAPEQDHTGRQNHQYRRHHSAINAQIAASAVREAYCLLQLGPQCAIDPIVIHRETGNVAVGFFTVKDSVGAKAVT